jgi:hypothetical protein
MITRSSRIAIMFAAFAAATAAAPLTAAFADATMNSSADVANGSGDVTQQAMTDGAAGHDTYFSAKRGPMRPAENLDVDNAGRSHGW